MIVKRTQLDNKANQSELAVFHSIQFRFHLSAQITEHNHTSFLSVTTYLKPTIISELPRLFKQNRIVGFLQNIPLIRCCNVLERQNNEPTATRPVTTTIDDYVKGREREWSSHRSVNRFLFQRLNIVMEKRPIVHLALSPSAYQINDVGIKAIFIALPNRYNLCKQARLLGGRIKN